MPGCHFSSNADIVDLLPFNSCMAWNDVVSGSLTPSNTAPLVSAVWWSQQAIITQHAKTTFRTSNAITRDAFALTDKDALIAKLKAGDARLRRLQFAVRSKMPDARQKGLFEDVLSEEIAPVEAALARQTAESERPAAECKRLAA